MGKRIKKPVVRPDVAKEWLHRHESDGESAPRIAQADGYDVRTVRRYLNLLREEREVREAKQTVLRQAIERHYVDLCSFAEGLKAQFQAEVPGSLPPTFKEDPMWRALHEHMPRSPLWKNIDKCRELEGRYNILLEQLRKQIREKAEDRTSLKFAEPAGKIGLAEGFVDALIFHLMSLARDGQGFKGEYRTEKLPSCSWVSRGAFSLALVPDGEIDKIKGACDYLSEQAVSWPEYSSLSKIIQEFLRIRGEIREELTKIILKRVLTGRCLYCPF